jgi:peptidoglycan/LPS O-acetylase OafA/YrhL
MSKKTNTLLFILGATVFNVLTTVVFLLILLVIYAQLLAPRLPEESAGWGFPVIFIASFVLSFLSYRLILKQVMKKIEMEKYFDPIFCGRRPPPKRD